MFCVITGLKSEVQLSPRQDSCLRRVQGWFEAVVCRKPGEAVLCSRLNTNGKVDVKSIGPCEIPFAIVTNPARIDLVKAGL
jgi:hypothetical protein